MAQCESMNGVAKNALLIKLEFAVNFADRQGQRFHHQLGIFQLRRPIDLGGRAVNQGNFKIQRYQGIALRGDGFQHRIHPRTERRMLHKRQNLVYPRFGLALNQQLFASIQRRNGNFGLFNDHVIGLTLQDVHLKAAL